jgi:hypothetical protein
MKEVDASVFRGMSGFDSAKFVTENPFELKSLKVGFSEFIAPSFKYYADTSVSYDFTIDSSEMNTAGIDLSILKTFTNGSRTYGIGSRNDRTRQVKRQFRNYDSFESLLNLPQDACLNVPEAVNALYPSVGFKRIDQLVDDFVEQNQSDNLGSKDHAEDAEMNDTMVFTTKTTGNFDPKLGRNGIVGATVPSQINVALDNYRQDIHTVIILLRLPADRSKLPKFDSLGRLILTEKQKIDNKFQQIRLNNFQDDVRNISNNSISLFKLQ